MMECKTIYKDVPYDKILENIIVDLDREITALRDRLMHIAKTTTNKSWNITEAFGIKVVFDEEMEPGQWRLIPNPDGNMLATGENKNNKE